MIDGIEVVGVLLEEDMTPLSVCVVTEQVEEHNRLEELPVFLVKTEVVILGIVVNILLERTRAIGTIVAERRERDNVKAKCLADQIGSNFTPRQRILREIPERLLAAQGFIHGGVLLPFVLDIDQEGVIRAKSELALDLIAATLDGCS
jgi:hypothetical protein